MGGGGEGGGGLGGGGEGGGVKGAALRTVCVYGGTSICVTGKPSGAGKLSGVVAASDIAAWSRSAASRASPTPLKVTWTETAQTDGEVALVTIVTPRRRAVPRRRRAAGKM